MKWTDVPIAAEKYNRIVKLELLRDEHLGIMNISDNILATGLKDRLAEVGFGNSGFNNTIQGMITKSIEKEITMLTLELSGLGVVLDNG